MITEENKPLDAPFNDFCIVGFHCTIWQCIGTFLLCEYLVLNLPIPLMSCKKQLRSNNLYILFYS